MTALCLCLVAQSCPTLCDPMDCSPPGSFVCGDSPGKNTGVSCGSSQPRDQTQVSHIAGGFFTIWTTKETQKEGKEGNFFKDSGELLPNTFALNWLCQWKCTFIQSHLYQYSFIKPLQSFVFLLALQILKPVNKLILIWPWYFTGLNKEPVHVKKKRA